MLSKSMYTSEYIQQLRDRTGADPTLLERVIYAFGLLEAITSVGLPFCFKGGTALMLLLKEPRRLSTDIDIIVSPGIDIDEYIRKAGELFPFESVEENIRVGKNNIEKRHFRFRYRSPRTEREVTILLDVVFEDINYTTVVKKPIVNDLLMTEGENLLVTIPDVNNILGDKLTAFAPHTTGIPFGLNKELEVIKQMYDCASLFDAMTDIEEVRKVYSKAVRSELAYRDLDITEEEVLKDTINGCLCIAARGVGYEDYDYYRDGISRIHNHIIGRPFSGDIAGLLACKVLYLAACLITKEKEVKTIINPEEYSDRKLNLPKIKRFSYIRLSDPISYGYLIEAVDILHNAGYLSE